MEKENNFWMCRIVNELLREGTYIRNEMFPQSYPQRNKGQEVNDFSISYILW